MSHQKPLNTAKFDPDFMSDFVQVLSALAAIAELGSAILNFKRRRDSSRILHDQEALRERIKTIRMSLRDLFEALDDVFEIYSRHYQGANGKELGDAPVKYGSSIFVPIGSFPAVSNAIIRVQTNFSSIRSNSMGFQGLLANQKLAGEEAIEDHLEGLNDSINSVLFDSSNFRDALFQLKELHERADRFLGRIESLAN